MLTTPFQSIALTVILFTLMMLDSSTDASENDRPTPPVTNNDAMELLDQMEKHDSQEKKDVAAPTRPQQPEPPKTRKEKQEPVMSPDSHQSRSQSAKKSNFKEIESKLQEYDHRVDILESELARLQANLNDASLTDNKVSISVSTPPQSKFMIRALRAKINGLVLTDQADVAGLWMPNQNLRLFQGPLRPGQHRLEIHTIIAPLSNEGLKLPTWKHQSVESSFELEVPDGKSVKNFVIALTDDENSTPAPKIKMTMSEAK